MEVTKLYNVVLDLINEESSNNLTKDLGSLVTQITSNQASAIEETLGLIQHSTSESVVNAYSASNLTIVRALKGETFFGSVGYETINRILTKNSFNISQTTAELQSYITARKEFIKTLNLLNEAFESLGFEPHVYQNEIYEIGLLLPSSVTDNKVSSVTKELQQWNKISKTLREMIGEDSEDARIVLLNNGSLEFFFSDSYTVALCVAFIIERTCALYKRILEIRELRQRLKQLNGPKSEQQEIEKYERETIDKELEQIGADLVAKFANQKLEKGRLNEIKVAVNGHVRYMAKAIDKGIVIEINTPEPPEPEILDEAETEENRKQRAKAEKDHKEKLAKIEVVKSSAKAIREVAGLGKDVFKYLTTGAGESDDEGTKPKN